MKQKQDVEKLLQEGHVIQLYPQGYSMYPLFVPGRDMAVIAPVRSICVGEVYLYRRDESILVLHRLLKKTEEGLFFVGDNQSEVEGPLHVSQLRGQLIEVVRNGHRISVKNPFLYLGARIWLLLRPARPCISRIIHRIKVILGGFRDEK